MATIGDTIRVPRTKLWGNPEEGYTIVLGCACGAATAYPGHPDFVDENVCHCGTAWYVVATDRLVSS